MKTSFIVFVLVSLISNLSYTQDCKEYDNLMQEGQRAFVNEDYQWAIKSYNSAMLNCPDRITEVQEKILDVFRQIEELKKVANEQKLRAEAEQKRAEVARDTTIQLLANLSKEKAKTDSVLRIAETERAKNDRIIGYFYFYKDSLALASERTSDTIIKYGFINKLGEPIIEFEYDEASSFDSDGFAEVSRDGNYYRINIAGEEFLITDEAKQLRDDILTLGDEEIKELSKFIDRKKYNRVLGTPIECERPTTKVYRRGQRIFTHDKSRTREWIVFSNQADNPVYEKATKSSAKVRKIQFMDAFYVVEEKGDWLKIATANGIKKLKSRSIKTVGWIPKDKLLLWRNSIISEGFSGSGYSRALRVYGRGIRSKGPCFTYKSPDKDIRNDSIEVYELLYIYDYDEKNDMYLLGTANQISQYNIHTIKGWVNQRMVQEWNARQCFLPNDDPEAVAERQAKGINLKVFNDEISVEKFLSGDKIEDERRIIWSIDEYDGKEWFFFMPILRKSNIGGNIMYRILIYTNYSGGNHRINEQQNIEKWEKYKNIPMWTEGFIPLNIEGLEHPLYKPYLFISDLELSDLQRLIERSTYIRGEKQELREGVIRAYKTIFMFHYGRGYEGASDETIEQVNGRGELPLMSNLLNNYSISDLRNPEKVSDAEITKIIQHLNDSSMALEFVLKLQERHRRCYKTYNADRYYLLSEELP